MNTLEEQLAQLKLINNRPLSPRTNTLSSNGSPKKVGPAVGPKPMQNLPQVRQSIVIQCEPLYAKLLQQQISSKSSSPTNSVNNNTNPNKLRFGSNDNKIPSGITSNDNVINNQLILHRKQPSYTQQHHVYSNIKMTLDNPAILDQQLEALEHHKKQLEKKGLMPSSNGGNNKTIGPKLSTASYINGEIAAAATINKISSPSVSMMTKIIEQQQQQQSTSSSPTLQINMYSNINKKKLSNSSPSIDTKLKNHSNLIDDKQKQQSQPDIVYSNIYHYQKFESAKLHDARESIYNNVDFNTDDFPPPPPAPLNLTDPSACLEYLNQQPSTSSTDELPPPPSPVSSSYSELRRATDNFPQMPSYPMITGYQTVNSDNSQNNTINDKIYDHHHSIDGNMLMIDNNIRQSLNTSQIASNTAQDSMIYPIDHHNGQHQTYMNTLYQNDYSTYAGPSSQSFSQSSSASDYYGYGSISQGSLTYDSIYEPINPRPTSQLSSRSNYSLYTSYVNGPQSNSSGSHTPTIGNGLPTMSNSVGINNNSKLTNHNKEAEVEALTDLLVHSMDSGNDVDSYGICVKCGERVVGENSGCTAMDQIYHIACFTCNQCQINLQGKPFYALENNPYCEEDYLNTLEKCSVCMKPILERILRATGKPYHPQCFTCVVCDRSLDGIPFTVDATNQNYCIQDFHKKFAPRCCVCRQPIMPEPGQEETVRVVALDRSFHFECYKCEDCSLLLSSEAEGRGCYPLDDHVLCKSCNAKRVQALTNRMTTEI